MSADRSPATWLAFAVAAAGALAILSAGIRHGTFVAADSDPYGYVSEADAMANGSLRIDQQFVRTMTWPQADLTFCPPGWRPAPVRGFIVPIYPPGLPIVMAAVQRLAGRPAIYYVVPALGALTVWLTAMLGASIHGPLTGTIAALLVASSPIFVYQVVQPVSDVPAAFWWTLTLALAVRRTVRASFAGGLAASFAILTRPNLAPLAVLVAAFLVWPARSSSRIERGCAIRGVLAFAIGAIPVPNRETNRAAKSSRNGRSASGSVSRRERATRRTK